MTLHMGQRNTQPMQLNVKGLCIGRLALRSSEYAAEVIRAYEYQLKDLGSYLSLAYNDCVRLTSSRIC